MNTTESFRFGSLSLRAKGTYLAHALKAVTKQHHGEMRPMLRRLIPRDGIVVDVGGHAGQFATLFARLASDGRVYSFEPGGYARSLLTLAIRANRIGNVVLRPEALGDRPRETMLNVLVKAKGSVRFGLSHLGAEETRPARRERVTVTTLDRFAAAEGLERLDFIKADIEGWEMRMLVGGELTIRRFRPSLMLEMLDSHLNRAGDSLDGAWALLSGWGFHPHRWNSGTALEPLATACEGDIVWCPGI